MTVNTKLPGSGVRNYQFIRNAVTKCLANPVFKSNLANEVKNDFVNLYMAQLFMESSLVPSKVGPDTSAGSNRSSTAAGFLSNPIVAGLISADPTVQGANLKLCVRAWGLGQSMGWNHVMGVSTNSNSSQCEIERIGKRLGADSATTSSILIKPGESPEKIFGNSITATQDPYLTNQIMASLFILADKYLSCYQDSKTKNWLYGNSKLSFGTNNRILTSMGAYLGLGAADVVGTNASTYIQKIVTTDYAAANSATSNANWGTVVVDNSAGVVLANQKQTGCTA